MVTDTNKTEHMQTRAARPERRGTEHLTFAGARGQAWRATRSPPARILSLVLRCLGRAAAAPAVALIEGFEREGEGGVATGGDGASCRWYSRSATPQSHVRV